MRLRGHGLTLTGAEGKSPPLPFITVDDSEGEALLSLYPKSIIRVDDDVEPLGLFGSDNWPGVVPVGDDDMALDDIVRAAAGDISSIDWNKLDPSFRESLISAEIHTLRREAGRDPQTNAFPNPEQVTPDTHSANDADGVLAEQVSDAEQAEHAEQVSEAGDASQSDGVEQVPGDAEQVAVNKRFNEIADAIDLLEPASFVATGPRKGRPKVKAVEEIIGYDVTMEEVDQVFMAAKAA